MNSVKPVLVSLSVGVGWLSFSEIPPNPLKAHELPSEQTGPSQTIDFKALAGVTGAMLTAGTANYYIPPAPGGPTGATGPTGWKY
jgi:hypothetical protein